LGTPLHMVDAVPCPPIFQMQALEEAVTAAGVSRTDAKAALVGRLETLEERVTNTQGMFRVLETQVASIEDLKGFATKAELAAKADLVAVQEVGTFGVPQLSTHALRGARAQYTWCSSHHPQPTHIYRVHDTCL
jgi:hypothetical protein